jgi:glycosyltransferase involved in cell wall biosynthesis
MIVRNEAANLPHCLDSVQGLWDELVVVDTGSEDATPALAGERGARVLHLPWTGDFAAARNRSLEACTGDWILVLDADEAVDSLDHPRIREACREGAPSAYRLWIRNYLRGGAFIGADGAPRPNDGTYREGARFSHHYSRRGLRLFRAQREPVFRGRVHELADYFFEERGLAVEDLEAVTRLPLALRSPPGRATRGARCR